MWLGFLPSEALNSKKPIYKGSTFHEFLILPLVYPKYRMMPHASKSPWSARISINLAHMGSRKRSNATSHHSSISYNTFY